MAWQPIFTRRRELDTHGGGRDLAAAQLHHPVPGPASLAVLPLPYLLRRIPTHCPYAWGQQSSVSALPATNKPHYSLWHVSPPTHQDQDSPAYTANYLYCPTTPTVPLPLLLYTDCPTAKCVEVSASAARRHLLCCPPKLVGPPTTAFSPRPNNSLSCPPALTRATNCAVLPVLFCAYQDYCLPTAPPPPQFRFLWGIVLGYLRPSRC